MRAILYVDMDDVLCDFTGSYHAHRQNYPHIDFPQSIPGFFEKLTPINGAIEGINTLRESERFDVYVLTAPSTRNPHSYTEKRLWIERYFGYEFTHNLIICGHKGLLRGDYLIDDNIEGKGQEMFMGRLLHFGSADFPEWGSILEELLSDAD